MTMTFIQHLLENEPTSETVVTLTEDYTRAEMEDMLAQFQAKAKAQGRIVDDRLLKKIDNVKKVLANWDKEVVESRLPPRGMNYQFDEIDPDVDAKSFSRAGAARRKSTRDEEYTNQSERGHHRRVAQDAYDRRWGSGDERSEHEMMHGAEEEEARAPAQREINKAAGNMMSATSKIKSDKRHKQRLNRFYKSNTGNNWDEEEESNMPAQRDRMKSIKREINTDLDNIHNKSLPSNKRFKQQGARFDRRQFGK